jgi:hypothetical protein
VVAYEIDPELGVHLVQDFDVVDQPRGDFLLRPVDVADLHPVVRVRACHTTRDTRHDTHQ